MFPVGARGLTSMMSANGSPEPEGTCPTGAGVGGEEKPASSAGRVSSERFDTARSHVTGIRTAVLIGLLVIAVLFTLREGRPLFLPIGIALLLTFMLRPALRRLRRIGFPAPVGAALLIALLLGSVGYGIQRLSGPAERWLAEVPGSLKQVEAKLARVRTPVERVSRAASEVEEMTRVDDGNRRQTVQVEEANLAETVITSTRAFIAGVIIVVALLYFLLAYGDVLASKIATLWSSGRSISGAARAAESEISTYLFTITLINAGLGVAVGGAMSLLGMPNPILWGVMAAMLNFIPYIGAMAGIAIVAVVALLTFDDPGRAALPPLCYFVLTGLEGQFLTPTILGYRLRLNPVVIFLWLVLWTWLWGVPGALLAVPILTALKIVCDQVVSLRPLGELITR